MTRLEAKTTNHRLTLHSPLTSPFTLQPSIITTYANNCPTVSLTPSTTLPKNLPKSPRRALPPALARRLSLHPGISSQILLMISKFSLTSPIVSCKPSEHLCKVTVFASKLCCRASAFASEVSARLSILTSSALVLSLRRCRASLVAARLA